MGRKYLRGSTQLAHKSHSLMPVTSADTDLIGVTRRWFSLRFQLEIFQPRIPSLEPFTSYCPRHRVKMNYLSICVLSQAVFSNIYIFIYRLIFHLSTYSTQVSVSRFITANFICSYICFPASSNAYPANLSTTESAPS